MSWGCPNMFKSRSSMNVVSNRWGPIRSLLRGYNPLGSRDSQVQTLLNLLSAIINDGRVVKYYALHLLLLIRYVEVLQILER